MDKDTLMAADCNINTLYIGKLVDGTIILCDITPGIALKKGMGIIDPTRLSNMALRDIGESVGCSNGRINTDQCAFCFVKRYEYKNIWDICSIIEKISDINSILAKQIVLYYHIRNVYREIHTDRSSLSSLFKIRF